MASIAQAASTSVASATNSPNTEPAVQPAANSQPDVTPFRTHDTVALTETGSRNASLGQPGAKAAAAFQVTYFPPSGSPDAQPHDGNATHAAQAAVSPASRIAGLGSSSQAASASVQANVNKLVTGISSTSATDKGQSTPSVSAASQAKLQQLNQVLQSLGINPNQISFADRLSLLPLVNDPQAIQQAIQGISPQSDVLNPASAQSPTVATAAQPAASSRSLASLASSSPAANSPSSASASAAVNTSAAPQTVPSGSSPVEPAHSATRSSQRTGQNVNISV